MFISLIIKNFYWLIFFSLIWGNLSLGRRSLAQINIDRQEQKSQLSLETFAQKTQNDRRWGRPPTRTSGGTRGACKRQLIALLPGRDMLENNRCQGESFSFMTATLVANPTIWIHVPPSLTSQLSELVILDPQQRLLALKSVNLPATEGIVGLAVDFPLKVNQGYRWQLSAVVDPQSPAQNPTVEGLIIRIPSNINLTKQVAAAKSQLEIARLYGQKGIWQDSLTSLAKLRCARPQDRMVNNDWSNLLDVGGLKAIASDPIVNCQDINLSNN
ncbi:DUF928 domain-containing protein [Pleurocapsa sp. PCC 7319]|uniref:DUF928 domain-containing protein n=1 Tax=Pleurocapsa sp. PCC 7319 TaxID=118161 RepID=UPI0003789364|nr:DUF928 domain-containing protein [Pleurocapsa sp. PCC 7319]